MSNSENNSTFNTIFWLVLIGGAIFWIRVYLRSSNSSVNNPQQSVNRSFILDSTSAPDQYGENDAQINNAENKLDICSKCNGNKELDHCDNCRNTGNVHCNRCSGYGNIDGRTCQFCSGSGLAICGWCEGGTKNAKCWECDGTGYTKQVFYECDECKGSGTMKCLANPDPETGICRHCNNSGIKNCYLCGGAGGNYSKVASNY
jgi:hypothetical protein